MKKINLLLGGVLLCTLVSAHDIVELYATGPSSFAITNASGSSLFKVYYKSEKKGRVAISIFDTKGLLVFLSALVKPAGLCGHIILKAGRSIHYSNGR